MGGHGRKAYELEMSCDLADLADHNALFWTDLLAYHDDDDYYVCDDYCDCYD